MKKFILFLVLVFSLPLLAQKTDIVKLRVPKQALGSGGVATYYADRTYSASLTDTTEWFNISDYDSVQVLTAANDSCWAEIKLIYGDGAKAGLLSSALDTLYGVSSSTGAYQGLYWAKINYITLQPFTSARVVLAYINSTINASKGTQRSSVYLRRFKK